MNPFESTVEFPLRFLIVYLKKDGESYLRKKFETTNDRYRWFDRKKGVICAQKILPLNDLRGELLDDETNTREFEITFEEYVQEEFSIQLYNSKKLISQQSRVNDDGQDLKLYKRILIDCLELQKRVDLTLDLNFKDSINSFISNILTYVHRKFNRYYPNTPEIKRVRKYYIARSEANITGFGLRPQVRNATIREFYIRLREERYIQNTREESIAQFLRGEIPKRKIRWISALHELHYFIEEIADEDILEKVPGQKWKFMSAIFSYRGEELPLNWERNNNKLKAQTKRKSIDLLIDMLRPRPQK